MIVRKQLARGSRADVVVDSVSGYQAGKGLTRAEAQKLSRDIGTLVAKASSKARTRSA